MKIRSFITLFVLMATAQQVAAHTAINIHQQSWFKVSTAQSSTLNASQKCQLSAGLVLESITAAVVSGNHYNITLSTKLPGCSFTKGYLYMGHSSLEARSLTVTASTALKKSTLQSAMLASADVCVLNPGVYPLSQAVGQTQGHYSVSLSKPLANCSFTSGYVYEGHAAKGIQAIGIVANTIFKKSAKESADLSGSEKCAMTPGGYALANPAKETSGQYYRVTLAVPQLNCGFTQGYIWYGHTSLENPETKEDEVGTGGSTWSFPMPGAAFSSGWCVCRNIGTSPHIGQDMYTYGNMRAFAVQDGRIEDVSFSSSCGYIAMVRDDYGSLWRYVHLNQPYLGQGQRISRGQTLASISAYPKSGCGSGAHLHFERRSSGAFKDAAAGKSCQNGYRSCYFDPMKPWRSGGGISNQSTATNFGASEAYTTSTSCKVETTAYAQMRAAQFSRYKQSTNLQQSISLVEAGDDTFIRANAALNGNTTNQCVDGKDCITAWGLAVKTTDGEYRRVFFDNAVRNQTLEREAEEAFCLPGEITGEYIVFARTHSGKHIKVEGRLF